jgi:hypothetical protein
MHLVRTHQVDATLDHPLFALAERGLIIIFLSPLYAEREERDDERSNVGVSLPTATYKVNSYLHASTDLTMKKTLTLALVALQRLYMHSKKPFRALPRSMPKKKPN